MTERQSFLEVHDHILTIFPSFHAIFNNAASEHENDLHKVYMKIFRNSNDSVCRHHETHGHMSRAFKMFI
ncbi:hypothetical protein [Bacillus nakamurai]|uniref:hypothetical protein n=1 Tax=Bacillus nakamurai TaxID=1793963 RepID=UPI0020C469F0|nr:hypothetical protein [Bacillus nakamurai]MCP6682282.1 hypothetical protein [Bacillus nakamurai]